MLTPPVRSTPARRLQHTSPAMDSREQHNMDKHLLQLLGLPKEVRLMMYELLPITTHHHIFEDPSFESRKPDITTPSKIILVAKSAAISLLCTCRRIYQEYKPTIDRNLKVLRSEPLRFIVDSTSFDTFIGMENCLASLLKSYRESIRSGKVLFFQPPLQRVLKARL
jgi:hypothetical protein